MKAKNIFLKSITAFVTVFFLIPFHGKSQTPGAWNVSGGVAQTTSTNAVGIGTSSPAGKTEIFYDCGIKGLVISRDMCAVDQYGNPPVLRNHLEIRDNNGGGMLNRLVFTGENKLGIGTSSPLGKTHINGADALYIERTDGGTNWSNTKARIGISGNGGPAGLRFMVSSNGGSSFTDALHIGDNGNIGMGTVLNSNSRLEVVGNMLVTNGSLVVRNSAGVNEFKVGTDGMVIARQIDVNLNAIVPDYVFHAAYDRDSATHYENQGSYKAMTLEEVEEFVKVNRHLPGIKSAADYQKAGSLNLGELNIKLLEKVEELTLYNIDLMKQVKQLESKLNMLEKQNK